MLVPIGEQVRPIYEGFRYVKNIEKVYFLVSNKTEKYGLKVKDKISDIYPIEVIYVNPESFDDVMDKLIQIVENNKNKGIIANITGGTKIMSLACYILCSYLQGNAFYIFKKDDGSMEYVEMPILKFKLDSLLEKNTARWKILSKLIERSYNSVTELANDLRRKTSTVSDILEILHDQGLIILRREGRNVRIEISKTGKIVFRLLNLKKNGE